MKVYIVSFYSYGSGKIKKVFSCRELAEKYARDNQPKCGCCVYRVNEYGLEE